MASSDVVTLAMSGLKTQLDGLNLQTVAGLDKPLSVVQGFPYAVEFATPRITLDAVSEDWRRVGGVDSVAITAGADAGTVAVTYRTHRILIDVTLDLWTANKTDRYKVLPHVQAAFSASIDAAGKTKPAGLEYTIQNHFNALAVAHWLRGQNADTQDGRDGLFRYSASLRVEVSRFERRVLSEADWQTTDDY